MKTKLLGLLSLLIAATSFAAVLSPPTNMVVRAPAVLLTNQSVTLAWTASPDPAVVGYNIYYGAVAIPTTNRLDVGLVTTATVSNLQVGVSHFFCATAYDAAGVESEPSNFITYTPSGPSFYIGFSHTNKVTSDLLLKLYSAPQLISYTQSFTNGTNISVWTVTPYTNFTLFASLATNHWLMDTQKVGGTNWLVPVSMPPGERFFRASFSNFWSETGFSEVVSTPPVIAGDLRLELRKNP